LTQVRDDVCRALVRLANVGQNFFELPDVKWICPEQEFGSLGVAQDGA
jgi:hypothetical protein